MGCVMRPNSSSQKSLRFTISEIGCWAKTSGVSLLVVASEATALAPFSQNSSAYFYASPSGSGMHHGQLINRVIFLIESQKGFKTALDAHLAYAEMSCLVNGREASGHGVATAGMGAAI